MKSNPTAPPRISEDTAPERVVGFAPRAAQTVVLPYALEGYVGEDLQVRVIDAFVDQLDLIGFGFERVRPAATGRPGYCMLKLCPYGYLNQVQLSRWLEPEGGATSS